MDELQEMHRRLQDNFEVDAIEVCTSADNSDRRRKPNPGMLIDASQKFDVDLPSSFFVGDNEKDILAGKQAGVQTILLQTDYNLSIHGSADYNCNSFDEIL